MHIVIALSELASKSHPNLVSRPRYDRTAVSFGVLHLGPGAFHRSHQAAYLDTVLNTDSRWGICGVSLRSAGVRNALRAQDYLYTLALTGESTSYRVIGSVREVLVAPENPQAVVSRLAHRDLHIVTSTITEKGYCLTPQGDLDVKRSEIDHDLQEPHAPQSAVGFICAALNRRRKSNIEPFAVVPCDNMSDNGRRVQNAVLQFARETDPELARWIGDEVQFPCTMVDSITPATDDALRQRVQADLGVTDLWPVRRERFSQWVVEDSFKTPRPDWESAGVVMTGDVRPFEEAKIRLLNGAHSALAYLGSLAGYETVAEAMRDAGLADFLRQMMTNEIFVSFSAPDGFDKSAYAEAILERFRNPNIGYELAQITWDGSQKIPFRLLNTIADNLKYGNPTESLMLAVAAWMKFVRRVASAGAQHTDPLRDELFAIAGRCNGEAANDVNMFLALKPMFGEEVTLLEGFRERLVMAYDDLGSANYEAVRSSVNRQLRR